MNIGKQSTLNDLHAISARIDGIEGVQQSVPQGSLGVKNTNFNLVDFPTSAMSAIQPSDQSGLYPNHPDAYGTFRGFVIRDWNNYGVVLNIGDVSGGNMFYTPIGAGIIQDTIKVLSTSNTVVDANGFIKAA